MGSYKDELHYLLDSLPEKEIPLVKRLLEFIVILNKLELNKVETETYGQTFYIEGSAGKYAELDFCGHIMRLDDVKGWGYLSLYDEDFEQPFLDVDFEKKHLPRVWPIYYALAAKCEKIKEPFLFENDLGIEKYVEGMSLSENTEIHNISKKLYANLEVAKLMLKNRMSFKEAVIIVAKRRDKLESTIRDQCTRQMGLNVKEFKELLKDKNSFINYMVEKFPIYREFIIKDLNS
ncbi:MAG: hypothetical protein K6T65_03815 [Peptococcaceae bacterium]|nr:hypothetical protein [Peptococcaceae bacterium]